MNHFRATHTSGEVIEYDAALPQPEHLGADWVLESISEAVSTLDPEAAPAPVKSITWTKLAFERKFTDIEWAAAQDFNANFEAHPALTAEQKLKIRRGLNDYQIATEINSTDPGTVGLLGIYEAFGVVAVGRALEILNGQ